MLPEPSPAPASMKTSWPCRTSSCTPAGVIATRFSLFLISAGIPMRMMTSLFVLVRFGSSEIMRRKCFEQVERRRNLGIWGRIGRNL
ncbi:hypothetical protein ACFPRL_21775 [Pseudoclavibacter helvolus]